MVQKPQGSSTSFSHPGSSQEKCLESLSQFSRSPRGVPSGLPVASAVPRVLQWVQPRRPLGTWSAVDSVLQSFPLGTELKRYVPTTERRLLWAYRLDQVINWGANGVVFRARLVLKVQGDSGTSARAVAEPASNMNNLLPALDKASGNGSVPLATDASLSSSPPSSAPIRRRATSMLQSLFRFGSLGQPVPGSDPQPGNSASAPPLDTGRSGEETVALACGGAMSSTRATGKEPQQCNLLHPEAGGWNKEKRKVVEGSEDAPVPPVRSFVTNRIVAVKILTTYPTSAGCKDVSLRSAMTLRTALDRAAFEAVLLSQLDHPGIVAFVDSFTAPPSFCIVVQEYLVGSVRRLVSEAAVTGRKASSKRASGQIFTAQQGRQHSEAQSVERALQLSNGGWLCLSIVLDCSDILGALNYLHSDFNRATSLSCVHRDVKTANLLLSSTARAKLVDFGVAVLAPSPSEPSGSSCSFNVGTTFAGTPKWMAPEQARLFNDEARLSEDYAISPAVDIWALGISVIEMATSHLPKELDGLDQEQTLRMVALNESYVPRLADGVYTVGAGRSGSPRQSRGSSSGGTKADTSDLYNTSPLPAGGSAGEPVVQSERANRLQVIDIPDRKANQRLSSTSQSYRVKLSFSSELKDFVAACVRRDPSERATAETLLAHPFFKINEKNIRQRPVSYRELFIRLSKEANRRKESGEKIKSSDEEEKRSGGTSPKNSSFSSSAPPLQNATAPYKKVGESAASHPDCTKPSVLNPSTHSAVQTSFSSRGIRGFQIGKFSPFEAVERLLLPSKRSSEPSAAYTNPELPQSPSTPDSTPSPQEDTSPALPDNARNVIVQPWSVLELLAMKHNDGTSHSHYEDAFPQASSSPATLNKNAEQLDESIPHATQPSSIARLPFFLPEARFTFSSKTKMQNGLQARLPADATTANLLHSRPCASDSRAVSLQNDAESVLARRSDCVSFDHDCETCAPQNIQHKSSFQESCSVQLKSRWDTAVQRKDFSRMQHVLSGAPYVSGVTNGPFLQSAPAPFKIFSNGRRIAIASHNGSKRLNSSKYGGQKLFASKRVLGSLNEDSDSIPSVFSEELQFSSTPPLRGAPVRVPIWPLATQNGGSLDMFLNWNRRHINKPTASDGSAFTPHLPSAHSTFESVQDCGSSAVSRILPDEDSADFCTVESESPLSTQGSAEFFHVADAISNVTPGSIGSRDSLVSPGHGNTCIPPISSTNAVCIQTESAVSLESRVADYD